MAKTKTKRAANPPAGMFWSRLSLKTRVTATSVIALAAVLAVFVLGTVAFFRNDIQRGTEKTLIEAAEVLAETDPITIRERFIAGDIALPALPSDYYIAFLDPDGEVFLGLVSSAIGDRPVPNLSEFKLLNVIALKGKPFTADIAKGSNDRPQEWRLVALPLKNLSGSVVVAIPTTYEQTILNQYRAIGFGFSTILLVIIAAALWLSVNAALKPLREVTTAADAVREGKLDSRLPPIEGNTEIAIINRSLNEMLDSVETSLAERNRTVNRMKEFVADASHELRTPLVTLRGYAELYRKGAFKTKAEVNNAMAKIEAEAMRMSSLVESLLALARLDNQVALVKAKTDLNKLINSVVENIRAGYPDVSISFKNLSGKTKAEKIEWNVDEAGITQVVTNLVSNARIFAGEKPIEITAGIKNEELVIEVIDHGQGIPKQLRRKVFERFYRSDNSRNRDAGGSGLGLAIAKEIVEAHGGKIVADETKGGGATFRITLPR
ncbi:MAG: sensor histidine kinase [Actinobacteria bacterium]|nr:sensor histidine kinase [Actinomycetota bacterium]